VISFVNSRVIAVIKEYQEQIGMQYHKNHIGNVGFQVFTLVIMKNYNPEKTEGFTFKKCFTLTILQVCTHIIFIIIATAAVIARF
jgi:hypothetical protein